MNGAGPALAGVAADVGPGQVEVLTNRLDEQPSGLDIELAGRPIDDERDVFAHGREPPAAAAMTSEPGAPIGPRESSGSSPPDVDGSWWRERRWWHRKAPESSRLGRPTDRFRGAGLDGPEGGRATAHGPRVHR